MSFKDLLHSISYEAVQKLGRKNPEVSALTRGIVSELAFTTVDDKRPTFQFCFLRYKNEFNGHLLQLEWKQKEFYSLIMKFVYYMSREYDLSDPVQMYNNYLSHVRQVLEYNYVSTVSNFEVERLQLGLGNKEGVLLSSTGIEIIPFLERKEFYRNLLGLPELTPPLPDKKYVYVILEARTGYFKIGNSKYPFKRERTLQSQQPDYMMLYYWEREKYIETRLHRQFRKKRHRGEWFKLSIDDLYLLNSIVREMNDVQKY